MRAEKPKTSNWNQLPSPRGLGETKSKRVKTVYPKLKLGDRAQKTLAFMLVAVSNP